MADEDRVTVFEQYPVASFSLGGGRRTFYFVIMEIREGGSNRIIRRRRPFRRGAKLDSTGRNEKVWTIVCCFDNSLDEPGLQNPPGRALYPHILNDMLDEVDTGETGDLQLPTRGLVRCRLESYDRNETYAERDSATVSFTFVEDNEDQIDGQSFTNPTVRATVKQAVDETVFGMESRGGFSKLLEDLENASTELQDAIAAPGETIQDIDQKAARVARIAGDIENQFLVSTQFGRDILTEPDAWDVVRQLRILQDRTTRAVAEKTSPIAPVVTMVVQLNTSLFDLAAQLAQDPTDLAAINKHLDDPFFIVGGTVVNIFQPTAG